MIEILKNQLIKFTFPLDYHFDKEKVIENKVVTNYTSYMVTYKLSSLTREIRFSLVDYYTHKRIFLDVYNIETNGHYSLPLDRYLKEHCHIKETGDIMLLDKYPGEKDEQKINNFFTFIKLKLNNRFFEILAGKDWVEIPTDWQGYR